jgi:hypothetical protein
MLDIVVKSLIAHVCGQAEFDEDKAYEGLENVIDHEWQKKFVYLLGRLSDEMSASLAVGILQC